MNSTNDALREKVLKAIIPIKKPDEKTRHIENEEFKLKRQSSSLILPEYYLVYFLFVDFLKFQNLGQWEKVAWIIPIDFEGIYYTIEYRKFGIGVFGNSDDDSNIDEIIKRVKKAVKIAEPYYESIAKLKSEGSELNVINNSISLYNRYLYFLDLYTEKAKKNVSLRLFEGYRERQQESWLALSAIDSFYSWTEQVFIHIGILKSYLKTGKEVLKFADLDWKSKYKEIIPLKDKNEKLCYDKLSNIKSQLRNFYAHGAFGKTGETFEFHSSTGAVPLKITSKINNRKEYSLHGPEGFQESDALLVIDSFVKTVLWTNGRELAQIYLMESGLPTILSHASDGVYQKAMSGAKEMIDFVHHLSSAFDNAANMDW
jgi:hypothetical protein